MNELKKRWEKMQLTKEESFNIEVGDEISEELRIKGGCSVVGKVWMERKLSLGVLEDTMGKVWRISQKARFKEVGLNIIVI